MGVWRPGQAEAVLARLCWALEDWIHPFLALASYECHAALRRIPRPVYLGEESSEFPRAGVVRPSP